MTKKLVVLIRFDFLVILSTIWLQKVWWGLLLERGMYRGIYYKQYGTYRKNNGKMILLWYVHNYIDISGNGQH